MDPGVPLEEEEDIFVEPPWYKIWCCRGGRPTTFLVSCVVLGFGAVMGNPIVVGFPLVAMYHFVKVSLGICN